MTPQTILRILTANSEREKAALTLSKSVNKDI